VIQRADFERMVREIENAPDAELLEVHFGSPASDAEVEEALYLCGEPLPDGMEPLYREMNGFRCQWRIARRRTDLLPEGNAPECQVDLLPLVDAEFAIFNDWLDLVWDEDDDLRQFVKPFDYQWETCAALYPVFGTPRPPGMPPLPALGVNLHERYREIYPTGYTFTEYLERLLAARGLSVFRSQLSPTLHRDEDGRWLAHVVREIFGAELGDLIKPGP
jgi:hypothetical protein